MRLLLSETAVGAPIGRPFCPLRSGRFSTERQFCFRRAANGRPYAKTRICAPCFSHRRRGAHWAPALSPAFRVVFRKPAILLSAGGRWPPLRGSRNIRILFFTAAVGAPIGRPFCPARSARFFHRPAILLPAGGRWPPLRGGRNMRILFFTAAVGAPIGRPLCPLRSGRFSANRQFCFRRAADGRPYVGKQTFYKKLLKSLYVARPT